MVIGGDRGNAVYEPFSGLCEVFLPILLVLFSAGGCLYGRFYERSSSRVKESKAGEELILMVSLRGNRTGKECRPILEARLTPRFAKVSARSLPSLPE